MICRGDPHSCLRALINTLTRQKKFLFREGGGFQKGGEDWKEEKRRRKKQNEGVERKAERRGRKGKKGEKGRQIDR